jgi:hypothetical protein
MGLKMIKAQGGIFGSVSTSVPVIAALSGSHRRPKLVRSDGA